MSEDKYKLFRNYMANELGISRDDIKQWTIDAVNEQTRKSMAQINVDDVLNRSAHKLLTEYGTSVKRDVLRLVAEIIAGQLSVAVRSPQTTRGDSNGT